MIFDPSQYENDIPQREPLKEGDYNSAIIETRMSIKDAERTSFMVKVEIIEGPSKGQWVWSWMHLKNKSEKAVQVAKAKLSQFCRALDITAINDFSLDHDDWAASWTDKIVNIHVTAKDAAQDYPSISWVNVAKKAEPKVEASSNEFSDDIPF